MNERYQPLACDLYDYLEIACLHHYQLFIEQVDGDSLEAEALTTETTPSKEEFLIVRSASGEQRLRLDQLSAITPLNAGASFGRVLLVNRKC
ncbi:Rho-binding antiterminator [Pseudomonas sp. UBA2684]|uniref:Rho-binding antiterminator n=1 Tax=Pseudomonas sp. UBA2684 TaxID=1947311 RepID=UPI000E9EB256|nr:Rho-binding antiterminator [Pseudomonas sp. UBA2684]HBX57562.1 transcriptional antiterminator [Pseudomonas sp.]|tara:strand:+ start:8385 stop:8660 length:276 start_codon:yes stop_codon:yes gene_type:complete